MRAKGLAVLVVLAVIVVGLAVLTSRKTETRTMPSPQIGNPVFPDLQNADILNSVAEIVFRTADTTITARKTGGTWVSPDRYGYAVKFSQVRDFLQSLAELKIGQVLPPDPAQRQSLGLAAGTSVALETADGQKIASFVLGKEHLRKQADGPMPGGYPDGRYISADGQAYLVTETFSAVPDSASAWLEKDLAHVSSYDVNRVTVTDPEGGRLELVRRGGAKDLALEDLADNEQMNSAKVSGLAGVLSYLTFTDVADPALPAEQTGMDKPVQCTVTEKSGKVFTLLVGSSPEGSEERHVQLSVQYVPPPPDKEAADPEKGDEEGGDADTTAERDKRLAGEVRDLNLRLDGWTFLVRAYKVDDITTDRTAFVEEEEPEEDATEDATDMLDEVEPTADADDTPEPEEQD